MHDHRPGPARGRRNGDVSGNGQFNSGDAIVVLRELNGIDRPELPPIPPGIGPLQFAGTDPVVSLPSSIVARPGERLVVPVNLDTAAGLESVQLRLAWDAQALTLLQVQRGQLTGGFQYFIQNQEPGGLVIDATALEALTGGTGSLIVLEFEVSKSAAPGALLLDLQWARLNDSRLTLNPAPQTGFDPTDATITVLSRPAAPTAQDGRRDAIAHALLSAQDAVPKPDHAPRSNWTPQIPLFTAPVAAPPAQPGWLSDFVNGLGRGEKERDANKRLRIPVLRK